MRYCWLVAVLLIATLAACGHGGPNPTGPTPTLPTTPDYPTPDYPAWRLDRGDLLNWMLGHRNEGEEWLWDPGNVHPLGLEWFGSQGSGEFYWVKAVDGFNFERFTYDPSFIRWREDLGSGGSYSWSHVMWVPRRMPADGTTLDNAENRIQWFDPQCNLGVAGKTNGRYPVYTTFHGIEEASFSYPVPSSEESLHISFRVGGSPFQEHYYYSWERGWYRWEYWHDSERTARYVSHFNDPRPGAPTHSYSCTEGT